MCVTVHREELLLLKEEAEQKLSELQAVLQRVSEDFHKVRHKLHYLLNVVSWYSSIHPFQ